MKLSEQRSSMLLNSQVALNQGAGNTDGTFVAYNLDIDATNAGNYLFAQNRDGAYGYVGFINCHFTMPSGRPFTYVSSSARSYAEFTVEDSEISAINRAGGQPVDVSDETAELIKLGIEYGELSGGLFDITIAPASTLWDFKDNESGTLPDAGALKEAVTHIDYRQIQVDKDTVTLSDPDARIDLGGIAKGYIADRLKDYLEEEGVRHALINLGGNMAAVGDRYGGGPFRIGLQKPFASEGTAMTSVEITDQSVVTSGCYERYFEKDGTIYHHILDPRTGYPIQNGLYQVTIISDSSADGDALSTACYALGLEKGMELIESLEGIEAVFVTSDYEIQATSGVTLH